MAAQKNLRASISNQLQKNFMVWNGNTPPTIAQFGSQAQFMQAQKYYNENGSRGTAEGFLAYSATPAMVAAAFGLNNAGAQQSNFAPVGDPEGDNPATEEKETTPGGTSRLAPVVPNSGNFDPNAPLGLPSKTAITGSPVRIDGVEGFVEKEPTYYFQDEYEEWNNLKTFQDINEMKLNLWWAGFYPPNMAPSLDGFKTDADFEAMRKAMNFANANTRDLTQVFTDRIPLAQMQGQPYRDVVSESVDGSQVTPMPKVVITDLNDPYYKLKEFAERNNLQVSEDWFTENANRIRTRTTDLNMVKNYMREKYISKQYPAWADDILAGKDVYELAEPYISEYANTLEVDRSQVSLSDPYIMKALDNVGKDGKPSYLPIPEFKQMLKSDDAWFFTKQANSEFMGVADAIKKAFGI